MVQQAGTQGAEAKPPCLVSTQLVGMEAIIEQWIGAAFGRLACREVTRHIFPVAFLKPGE